MTSDATFKLPNGDGSAGQVLSTDGSKNLGWASVLTSSLNQNNINLGDSSNVAQQANTNLLGSISGSYSTAAVSFTNATPTVVTWTSHGLATGSTVYFTGGSLPTGVSASTRYFITSTGANTFKISTSIGNAQNITFVATSSTGTGTGFASGLVLRAGVPGTLDGSSATAGYIGETRKSVVGATSLNTSTFVNITNLALTAGTYDVSGMTVTDQAAANTGIIFVISKYDSNVTTDHVVGDNLVASQGAVNGLHSLVIPQWRVTITTTDVANNPNDNSNLVFIKAKALGAAVSTQGSRISVVRVW